MKIGGASGSPFEGSTLKLNSKTLSKDENNQSAEADPAKEKRAGAKNEGELSSSEQALVAKLQARDAAVRAHEAAHIAAGAGVVSGGASFTYQTGPDGKQYAIGGEVPIDAGGGSSPDETIQKAQRIRSAAMAPSDPSPQDFKVAASASIMEAKARAEKIKEDTQEAQESLKKQEAKRAYAA